MTKSKRGRPRKPGGRGDKDAVAVAVRFTATEAKRLDALARVLTRGAGRVYTRSDVLREAFERLSAEWL